VKELELGWNFDIRINLKGDLGQLGEVLKVLVILTVMHLLQVYLANGGMPGESLTLVMGIFMVS